MAPVRGEPTLMVSARLAELAMSKARASSSTNGDSMPMMPGRAGELVQAQVDVSSR